MTGLIPQKYDFFVKTLNTFHGLRLLCADFDNKDHIFIQECFVNVVLIKKMVCSVLRAVHQLRKNDNCLFFVFIF